MWEVIKKYGFLLHILVLICMHLYFSTDIRFQVFYHPRVSLWLTSLPYFMGIAYGIFGILSIKRSVEGKESYRKGVFYIVIGFLILGAGGY